MTFNSSLSIVKHPIQTTGLTALIARAARQVMAIPASIPPAGLVLISSFAIQFGSAFSKTIFDTVGSSGTVFVCKLIAAVLLLVMARPRWRDYTPRDYGLVIVMGMWMAGMNLAIYGAISRIPLGIASALEFLGPLALALAGSRQILDLLWVVFAATGVFLLAPTAGFDLNPIGVGLALVAAGCWAGYILASVPVGRVFSGGTGLAIAMSVATGFLAVPGIAEGGMALLSPIVLLVGIVVAVIGTMLPYSLEYAALKRISPRTFGILLSIEPAIATIIGFIFLKETIDLRASIAISCVIIAAIGVTLGSKK